MWRIGSSETNGTARSPPRWCCVAWLPLRWDSTRAAYDPLSVDGARPGPSPGDRRARARRPDHDHRPPGSRRRAGAGAGRRRRPPNGDARRPTRSVTVRRRAPSPWPTTPRQPPSRIWPPAMHEWWRSTHRRVRRRAGCWRSWARPPPCIWCGERPRSRLRGRWPRAASHCARRSSRCGWPSATVPPSSPLAPETVERCRAVLGEVGLVSGASVATKVDLEESPTYREAVARIEAVKRFLASDQVAV